MCKVLQIERNLKTYLVLKPKLAVRSTLMSIPRFHARPRFPKGSRKPCRLRRGLGSSDPNTGTNNGTQEGRLGTQAVTLRQIQTGHVRTGCPQVP